MKKTCNQELEVVSRSHKGLVREENQDAVARFPSPFGEVFLVADGMGGHRDGALASAMVMRGFATHLAAIPKWMPRETALQEAASRTNGDLYSMAEPKAAVASRMGSTVVMAVVEGSSATIAHAGDSRAYLFRGGSLQRLTNDHTLVQWRVEQGLLTEEQAAHAPDAGVLSQAFGVKESVELELSQRMTLSSGDLLLLCSDGLSGLSRDHEIEAVLRQQSSVEELADELIQLAFRHGGSDNVTVQLIRFGPLTPAAQRKRFATTVREMAIPAPIPETRGITNVWKRRVHLIVLSGAVSLACCLAGHSLWRWILQSGTQPPPVVRHIHPAVPAFPHLQHSPAGPSIPGAPAAPAAPRPGAASTGPPRVTLPLLVLGPAPWISTVRGIDKTLLVSVGRLPAAVADACCKVRVYHSTAGGAGNAVSSSMRANVLASVLRTLHLDVSVAPMATEQHDLMRQLGVDAEVLLLDTTRSGPVATKKGKDF